MELRTYRDSDRDQVIRLHEALKRQEDAGVADSPNDDDLRDIESAYFAAGGEFWVGEESGAIVATGAICIKNTAVGEIRRLGVKPELQRLGYGGRMLNKLEERGLELGYRIMCAETSEHHTAARNLLARSGYEVFDRQTAGGVSTAMFGKWITDPPPERTPEETAKFEVDLAIHNRVFDFAKQLLKEGNTPEQAKERLLLSDPYAEWCAKERSFGSQFDDINMYRDLEESIRMEAHIGRIEEMAADYFGYLPDKAPESDGSEAAEHVLMQLNVTVTPKQLAYKMASLARELGLGKPIPYKAFLALLTGVFFEMDPEDLERMNEQREHAAELMQSFVDTYGDGSGTVRTCSVREGGGEACE